MPNFKKQGRGFKMKGFSPFNMGKAYKSSMKKHGDYDPQTVTRRDPNTDITPQSQEGNWDKKSTKTTAHSVVGGSKLVKTKKKSKLGNILLGALGGSLVAGGIGGVVGAIKGAGGIKNIRSKLKGKNKGGKVWKA